MKLQKLGEFGLIDRIAKKTKKGKGVVLGIGDDCAVLEHTKDKYLLVTCDMLVEGVHFLLNKATPSQIGHKALGCGLSDIAAMGGVARYAVVSVGLPKKLSVEFVDNLYKGIKTLADKFKVSIVGGDTNKSDKLVLDITVIGEVKKDKLVKRSGAKIGDFIFVTGALGGSIRGKHLSFTPRLKEANYLVNNFKLNSMIDVSDGISSDLNHILKQSKVGARLFLDKIPLSKYAKSVNNALNDGEDFELLFTLPKQEAKRLLRSKPKGLVKFTHIGEIVKKGKGAIPAKGFRHF